MKIFVAAACFALGACGLSAAVTPDDQSFFKQPDEKAWPGNTLSPEQYESAVKHFADPDVCHKGWSWALIGPRLWLLKGTRYLIEQVSGNGGYVPNIHYGRGYWGNERNMWLGDSMPIAVVKTIAAGDAARDCSSGRSMTRLTHNDLPDNEFVAEADRYDSNPEGSPK